jgi:hypothetical protein
VCVALVVYVLCCFRSTKYAGPDLCWAGPLAKLAAWALSLMYMSPKLAAWALRLEAGAIDEVTIAIDCEDREESSRRCSPQGNAGPSLAVFFNV